MPSDSIDDDELPYEYRSRILDLRAELEDGDITQKGFEKKRRQVIQEYLLLRQSAAKKHEQPTTSAASAASSTRPELPATSQWPTPIPEELSKPIGLPSYQRRPQRQPLSPPREPIGPNTWDTKDPSLDKRGFTEHSISRQSTVYGYKKPGIDFGSLLVNDLDTNDSDNDSFPPRPDVPKIPTQYRSVEYALPHPCHREPGPTNLSLLRDTLPHEGSQVSHQPSAHLRRGQDGNCASILDFSFKSPVSPNFHPNEASAVAHQHQAHSRNQSVDSFDRIGDIVSQEGVINLSPKSKSKSKSESESESESSTRQEPSSRSNLGNACGYSDVSTANNKLDSSKGVQQGTRAVTPGQHDDGRYGNRPASKQSRVSAKTQNSAETTSLDRHDSPIESVTIDEMLYASYSTRGLGGLSSRLSPHGLLEVAPNPRAPLNEPAWSNTSAQSQNQDPANTHGGSLLQSEPMNNSARSSGASTDAAARHRSAVSLKTYGSDASEQSVTELFSGLERDYEQAFAAFNDTTTIMEVTEQLSNSSPPAISVQPVYDPASLAFAKQHRDCSDSAGPAHFSPSSKPEQCARTDDRAPPTTTTTATTNTTITITTGTVGTSTTTITAPVGLAPKEVVISSTTQQGGGSDYGSRKGGRPAVVATTKPPANSAKAPAEDILASRSSPNHDLTMKRKSLKTPIKGGKGIPYPYSAVQRAIETSHGSKVKRNISTRMSRGPTMYYPPEAQHEAITTFQEIEKQFGPPSVKVLDKDLDVSKSDGDRSGEDPALVERSLLIIGEELDPTAETNLYDEPQKSTQKQLYGIAAASVSTGEKPTEHRVQDADNSNGNDNYHSKGNGEQQGHKSGSGRPMEALPPGSGSIVYPRQIPQSTMTPQLQYITTNFTNIASILRYRAHTTPKNIAYTCVDNKGKETGSWTWQRLHQRAERIMQLIRQKNVVCKGDRIALVYRKYEMLDFVGSLFGCFYAGMCAVPIVAGDSYSELVHILNSTGALLVLTTELNIRALNRDLQQSSLSKLWPSSVAWVRTDHLGGPIMSSTNMGSSTPAAGPASAPYSASPDDGTGIQLLPTDVAYIEFSKSPNGELKGVQVTHGAIMTQNITWVMSVGLLGVGRVPIKTTEHHQSELTADDAAVLSTPTTAPGNADASKAGPPASRGDRSALGGKPSEDAPTDRLVDLRSRSGSHGFLNRLKNAGSLVSIRRKISRTRSKELSMVAVVPLQHYHQQSMDAASVRSFSSGAPNYSVPTAGVTTNANIVAASGAIRGGNQGNATANYNGYAGKVSAEYLEMAPAPNGDVLVSYVEPRQHLGLTLGILCGVFGGHRSVYVSSTLLDTAGAYIHLLTRYNATIAIGDYSGLQSVLSTATDEPSQILNYNKKVAPNLSTLRAIVIDTLYIDNEFHRMFNNAVLHSYGCPYQQIQEREHHPVMMPTCTLAEHGSILLSVNDTLSKCPPANICDDSSAGSPKEEHDGLPKGTSIASRYANALDLDDPTHDGAIPAGNDTWEYVLDREALKDNRIMTLPDEKGEDGLDKPGTVRYPVFGYPALQSTIAVVDPETRELCPPNSVGELWIDSPCLGSGFWGLPKLTNSIFSARFFYHMADTEAEAATPQITYNGHESKYIEDVTTPPYKLVQSEQVFLRTGLMGALVRGKVMVFGFYEDRIRSLTLEPPYTNARGGEDGDELLPPWQIEPRLSYHYAGDVTNTIKHSRPQVTECTAFEIFVNETHLPVIVAEVRSNVGAYAALSDEIYNDVKSRHGLFPLCIALCHSNTLPRAFQYGKRTVNAQLCRYQFETGQVHCLYVKLCTENLFLNLPPPASELNVDDFNEPEDPSIMLYGHWLQQTSLEESFPSIDERTGLDLKRLMSITDVLIWRASMTPKETAYVQFDVRGRPVKSVTFEKLLLKVSNLAHYLCDKKNIGPGDHVLVLIMPGLEYIYALHACLAIGAIPIPIAPPDINRLSDDLLPILVTASEFKVRHMLVNAQSEETMRHKNVEAALKAGAMRALLGRQPVLPVMVRTFKAPKNARPLLGQGTFKPSPVWADPSRPALIMQFTGSQPATPQYVSVSHPSIMAYCSQQKSDFQMLSNHPVITSVRAYNGYGLLHCTMIGIYVGCTTLLLNSVDYFTNPGVWFDLVYRYKVKDAFATTPMLQHAMNFIKRAAQPRTFSLHNVRNLIVATEERVDPQVYDTIRNFFAVNRLEETALNPLYGTLMNPCISTRAYLGVRPLTLRLDLQALRRGKVWVLPREPQEDPAASEMYSLTLQDSGKVSGSTMVAIVDPVTRSVLPASHVGEIWVYSNSNALQRQTLLPPGATLPGSHAVPHSRAISTNTTGKIESDDATQAGFDFVRTGDLGFLYLDVEGDGAARDDGEGGAPAPAEPYLFVIGKISETLNINGYMYFITDIERTIEDAHNDLQPHGCTIIQTSVPPAKSPSAAVKLDNVDSPTPGNGTGMGDSSEGFVRTVAIISVRNDPRESHLPNAACLIFNAVLDSHQILLDEIVFVPKNGLPRSRIAERRRRTVRALYEHGRLRVLAAYQITHQQHMYRRSNQHHSHSPQHHLHHQYQDYDAGYHQQHLTHSQLASDFQEVPPEAGSQIYDASWKDHFDMALEVNDHGSQTFSPTVAGSAAYDFETMSNYTAGR